MTLKEKLCEPFGGLRNETVSELEKISEDFAIKFAEWIGYNKIRRLKNGKWLYSLEIKELTTKELLEIYKRTIKE